MSSHNVISLLLLLCCALLVVCSDVKQEGRKRRDHAVSDTIENMSIFETPTAEPRKRRNKKRKSSATRFGTLEENTTPVVSTNSNIFHLPSSDYRQTQCKEIPPQFALCYDIGYANMHLPNLQGHDTMEELLKQSKEWTPLLATRCHPEARKFLCSVFAPVCLEDFVKPIPPCRSLCEAVRDGCTPTMAGFNYPWPQMLKCSQFPADDTLCIPLETTKEPSTASTTSPAPTKTCAPCRQKKITSTLRKKICSFDFVMKVRVKLVSYHKGNTKITLERKSRVVYKLMDQIQPRAAGRKLAKKSTIWMRDGLNCTCDVLDSVNTPYLITGWKDNDKLMLHTITRWRKGDRRLIKQLRKKSCRMQYAKNKRSSSL